MGTFTGSFFGVYGAANCLLERGFEFANRDDFHPGAAGYDGSSDVGSLFASGDNPDDFGFGHCEESRQDSRFGGLFGDYSAVGGTRPADEFVWRERLRRGGSRAGVRDDAARALHGSSGERIRAGI